MSCRDSRSIVTYGVAPIPAAGKIAKRSVEKYGKRADRSGAMRGSLTAQGELKRTGYDPLFNINHTLAMVRDNIKRLARKTWCTTKRADALDDVIAIYIHFHNTTLVA